MIVHENASFIITRLTNQIYFANDDESSGKRIQQRLFILEFFQERKFHYSFFSQPFRRSSSSILSTSNKQRSPFLVKASHV